MTAGVGWTTAGFFINIKGPELLSNYVGEAERYIRLVFQMARQKASEGMPVVVFFDEMDSIFRTRDSGVSSGTDNTIVPQLLSEIDSVAGLENVIVIGATNREDLIGPAILRPGRLDVNIKIGRPDAEAARDIFSKYVTKELPLHRDDLAEHQNSAQATVEAMIQRTVERMYTESEENRFLEVTYANGDKEVLHFKDFISGAVIENIVARAKKIAIKEFLDTGQPGLRVAHLLASCVVEFTEAADMPNTTGPDGWARISDKKGERIVYIKTLVSGKSETPAGDSIDAAYTDRSTMAVGSPFPACPWSAQAVSGWNPKVFFQVGAAWSLPECATTMVASRSTVTRPPSAPGALSPARAQARSRAAARAARIAFSAGSPSAARSLTSRDTTGSDATGPARSGCSRSTAMSARQSPPRATAAARSAMTFPGSWTARGARHRARFCDRPRPSPVTRIVSHSSTAPAWDTIPRPSADTVTRLPRALFFTWKVPSARVRTGLSTSPILPGQRHFFHLYRRPGLKPGESPRLVCLCTPRDLCLELRGIALEEALWATPPLKHIFRASRRTTCYVLVPINKSRCQVRNDLL